MHADKFKKILNLLCENGLSDYYVLFRSSNHTSFGKIQFDKGHLALRDTGLLTGLNPEIFEPVWHQGLVGMICKSGQYEWDSLTYYGLEECQIKPDLGSTRGDLLIAAQNQYGESIVDFRGSIYRGFQLLLDNSFLPVILLNTIFSRNNEPGLIVSDLRTVPLNIKLLIKLNDLVVKSVEQYNTVSINDVDMSSTDFHKYFDGLSK